MELGQPLPRLRPVLLYDSALDIVLSSDTYHQLVTKPYLQEEGSLFVCELLEKELEEQRAETPAEA